MNKKGFTLIELLAVIIILAIIALIATPIVLNIIEDVKEQSSLRSADFYLDAIELAIVQSTLKADTITDGTYNIKDGNICRNADCSKTLEVEVNGEVPTSGTVTIKNGQIDNILLTLDNKVIIKNNKGELVYQTLDELCELQEGYTAKTVGAKYSCNLGDGERYFYVLEVKTDEVALILEGNYDTETLPWCDQSGPNPEDNKCNADGLTGKLDEISNDWTKLSRKQIGLPSALQIIVANNPAKNTIDYTDGIQSWLYNWDNSVWGNRVYGYWTSTPDAEYSLGAWLVHYYGFVNNNDVNLASGYGVRPVINLKL